MLTLSTINFRARGLVTRLAGDSDPASPSRVMNLAKCRLLGLCVCAFSMSSCIVTSWNYPTTDIQEATRLRDTVRLRCTTDSSAPRLKFLGAAVALKAIMEKVKPDEGLPSGDNAPRCEAWLYQVHTNPPTGTGTPYAYNYFAAMTLGSLPAFIKEEYGVVYTVFPPGLPQKEYEYRISNDLIFWLGFLPIGWVSLWVDPRPAKAVEATYFQFLLDTDRDGYFK